MGGSRLKNDIHYHVDYGKLQANEIHTVIDSSEPIGSAADHTPVCQERIVFWQFPGGKGAVQPWRRKLWILQNNPDSE